MGFSYEWCIDGDAFDGEMREWGTAEEAAYDALEYAFIDPTNGFGGVTPNWGALREQLLSGGEIVTAYPETFSGQGENLVVRPKMTIRLREVGAR